MKTAFTLLIVFMCARILSGQDYMALMSGSFYVVNPTSTFKMDSLIKKQSEKRWKKISYNGKTSYKGIDYEITRNRNLEIKKRYDNKGILDYEKTTIIKSESEVIILEKYLEPYETYFDSTYKTYAKNGLLDECATYSFTTDTIVKNLLTSYLRSKNEYDSLTGQIVKIEDYAIRGLIRKYIFNYNTKGQLEKIEVRDSIGILGRFCLFNYIKRSENRDYTANWHRSDSVSHSQTIFERDPIDYTSTIIRKEYGFMHDEGFSPSRKPRLRTVVHRTEEVNKGKVSKVDYISIFEDHELDGIYKITYDRFNRRIKEEYSSNGKYFSSKTHYWYKTK